MGHANGGHADRYTVEPRYNDPRYNDIPGITIISKFLAHDNDFPAFSLVP